MADKYNGFEKVKSMIRRGDVVLCDLGFGEGSEQSGMRPCVVIQNDVGNKFSTTLIVATITSSTTKAKLPTHIEIDEKSGLDKPSIVLCEQVRTIDKNRVKKYLGSVPRQVREKIDMALVTSLEIFKKGEIEVREQAIKVECLENTITNMYKLSTSSEVIESLIKSYKEELMMLENLCKSNRLYMKNYYKRTEKIIEIIDITRVNTRPILKVV